MSRFRVELDPVAGNTDVRVYVGERLSGSLRMPPAAAVKLAGIVAFVNGECPTCQCRGRCRWVTAQEVDEDAVVCGTCGCRWCGPMTPRFQEEQRARAEAARAAEWSAER